MVHLRHNDLCEKKKSWLEWGWRLDEIQGKHSYFFISHCAQKASLEVLIRGNRNLHGHICSLDAYFLSRYTFYILRREMKKNGFMNTVFILLQITQG